MSSLDTYMSYNAVPVLMTVEEMARLLRVSRNTAYSLIKDNKVAHITVGKQIRIPRENVFHMLSTAA